MNTYFSFNKNHKLCSTKKPMNVKIIDNIIFSNSSIQNVSTWESPWFYAIYVSNLLCNMNRKVILYDWEANLTELENMILKLSNKNQLHDNLTLCCDLDMVMSELVHNNDILISLDSFLPPSLFTKSPPIQPHNILSLRSNNLDNWIDDLKKYDSIYSTDEEIIIDVISSYR